MTELRIVRGHATPDEAKAVETALTVVATAAEAARVAAERRTEVQSLWARPSRNLPLRPGPGAWRASNL